MLLKTETYLFLADFGWNRDEISENKSLASRPCRLISHLFDVSILH